MAIIGTVEGILKLRDEFTTELQRASGQLKRAGADMQRVGRQMSSTGADLTRAVTVPLAIIGAGSVKAASTFESSFAGIRKTVDATDAEFDQLSDSLRELAQEIPTNVNELNRIGESAGQLGIETENIVDFTRVMADLGVTTNLSADEAATSLARFVNVTQSGQDVFSNLGSTIVDLGNNFATTEAEITNFGLRIAGAGQIAGLAQSDILAIGAAMTSVGVQAEAGGTAVQKVLLGMVQAVAEGGAELEIFAATAGETAADFADLFERDAAEAFNQFVQGLGRQGTEAFKTLEQLELQDQRLIRSILSLASAGDLLTDALATGAKAFDENTALAKEAEQRYETFASQLTLAGNQVREIAITLGQALLPVVLNLIEAMQPLIQIVADLAQRFAEMPEGMQQVVAVVAALVAALGPVVLVLGQVVIAFGAITTLAPAVAGAVTLMLGPWGLLAVAIGGVTALTMSWIAAQNEALGITLQNVASTQSMGMSLSALRGELSAAKEEQRALNAELVRAVGEGLAPLGASLNAAKDKLAQLQKAAAATKAEMGSSGLSKAVRDANAEVEEQAGLVANLESQWDQAQVLLRKASEQGFEPLAESAEQVNNAVDDLADTAAAAVAPVEAVSEAADDVDTSFSAAIQPLEEAALAFDEVGIAADESADMVVDASKTAQAAAVDLSRGFSSAFSGFADSFGSSISAAAEAGNVSFGSMKEAGKGAFDSIAGGTDAVSVAFGAATGEWEGLAVGALTAVSKFASGDWVGAMIAAIGVVVGAFKKLFGGGKSLAEEIDDAFKALADGVVTMEKVGAAGDILVKTFTRVAAGQNSVAGGSQVLADNFEAFFDAAVKMGDAGLASITAVVNAAREAGVDMAVIQEKLDETLASAEQALADRTRFIQDQSQAIIASVEAMFASSARITARDVRFAATSIVQAFDAARMAGVPLTQIMADLRDSVGLIGERANELGLELPQVFERFGEMLEILGRDRIQGVIGRLEAMGATVQAVGNLGLLTAGQFDAFGDRLDKVFSRLVNQGLTGEEALAALAPQLQQLQDLSEQYGFELDKNTRKLLDQALAQGVVQEKGLTTEDILIKGFDRTIETLNRLIEAMGGVPVAFEEWSDSAVETAETIDEAAAQSEVATTAAIDGIVDASVAAAAQNQQAWTGSFNALPAAANQVANQIAQNLSGIPISFSVQGPEGGSTLSAQEGTGGFRNFGAGTPAILHGTEAVVTAQEGMDLAGMVGQAIAQAMGGGGEGDGGAGAPANVEATNQVNDTMMEAVAQLVLLRKDVTTRGGAAASDPRWPTRGNTP